LPAAALLAAALAEPGGRQALAAAAGGAGLTGAARLLGDASVPDDALAGPLRQALLAEPAATERLAAGPAALRLLAGPDSYPLTPYGPAGTILHLSYYQVVNGDPDALALLHGRILFFGTSDPGERVPLDTFPTAFGRPDGVDPAGVEIAATACLNLLAGDLVRPLPAPAAAALAAGMAALAAILGTALAPPLAGAAVALEGGALTAVALRLLGSAHLLLPAGSLLALALPLGLLTGLLARYGIARRQLDRVTGFLTRGRVRRADPLDPLAQAEPHRTRWAVALATDLAGYVRLTEGMRAREPDLAALLTDYRGLLHAIIERHGGTVLDFAGDASMCVWDAERPSEDLRRRAVRAVLDLVRELDLFAAARGLDGHPTRVGLAEGEIVLGNLAGGPNFTYGAVGEPLNVAARLEQLNKQHGTRIMATGSLVRGRDDLAVRPLGELVLRGRAVSEEVVAVEPATAGS
jgi:adenylate cyclase